MQRPRPSRPLQRQRSTKQAKASQVPKYTTELIRSTLIKLGMPLTREDLAREMGLKKEGGLGRKLANMVRDNILVNFRAGTQPPGCRKPIRNNWGYWPKDVPLQDREIDYQPVPPTAPPVNRHPVFVKLYHGSGLQVTVPLGVGLDPTDICRELDNCLAAGLKAEPPDDRFYKSQIIQESTHEAE